MYYADVNGERNVYSDVACRLIYWEKSRDDGWSFFHDDNESRFFGYTLLERKSGVKGRNATRWDYSRNKIAILRSYFRSLIMIHRLYIYDFVCFVTLLYQIKDRLLIKRCIYLHFPPPCNRVTVTWSITRVARLSLSLSLSLWMDHIHQNLKK